MKIIRITTSITAIMALILAMFTIAKYRKTRSSQDYNKWVIYMIVWLSSILIHHFCK